jgi:hypothetical protein
MAQRCEVWERRPGGRWEVVYNGSAEAANSFILRCRKARKGARFAAPVEQVVLPLGEPPFRDTSPTAVIV